jgi:lipopolysaccharide/colanic/teichoic acid biosynthesis glycosyltransferase
MHLHQSEHNLELLKSPWWRLWMDCYLSAVALLLLSPFLLMIAFSIFLESGWPVLFSQGRVGRNGKLFHLLKFRTMRHGTIGPSLTVAGDCRVTRVGHFLRKFKLDELPQLWNIVRGEMSVVGPRPEVPEFVDLSKPVWQSVLQVRPGITDPASIAFHQEENLLAKSANPIRYYREIVLPAKLAMNIAYLQKRSVWLDVQVVIRTIQCAVFPGKLAVPEANLLIPEDSK